MRRTLPCLVLTLLTASTARVIAQPPRALLDSAGRERRYALEKELESIATIDRRVMVPMRDGTRLMTDVYRPKNLDKAPTIFVRTPYDFNYWDVRNAVPADMSGVLTAVKHGYAYVEQNERGQFFSQGVYDILGPPRTDGYDMITWLHDQPWSNGKVGLIGCSSSAEWQLGVAATDPPGLAAIVPEGFGAGIGRVKPFMEQGNWYRGGAVQMLFIYWLHDYVQYAIRPSFPAGTSQTDLQIASRYFDLGAQAPRDNWPEAFKHLPEQDMLKAIGGEPGIFADSEPNVTGGRMIQRTPNDPAWFRGGLYHDDMRINVPGLYLVSWYDVSVGPNLALVNHVRATASPEVGRQTYVMIAPTLHCGYTRATEHTVVGERDEGDARWDYAALTYGWFDHFLKGEDNRLLDTLPRVRYYLMGLNRWEKSDSWPPKGAQPVTYYLESAGHANTAAGDGALGARAPGKDQPDGFSYDPMNPTPTYGGGFCCMPGVADGSRDQREMETRPDILVYTTPAFKEGTEVSGPITATLYVSSDRKDTDFTVRLEDVYPDGRAFNLDETIQRVRYRDGYDKEVWMEPGKVYPVTLSPMTTSNYFDAGHRLRIEVSSSNFPRFDRNLNTGGHNYDETTTLVAHNEVHHSRQYPSSLTITVVPHKAGELATAGK